MWLCDIISCAVHLFGQHGVVSLHYLVVMNLHSLSLLQDSETFPSGCLTLDLALGGGLPKGRIVEVLLLCLCIYLFSKFLSYQEAPAICRS